MTVKTIRFNDNEEAALEKVLDHYNLDFSTCVKTMLFEKLEDLKDIRTIKHIKEGNPSDYVSDSEIDALFDS